MPNRAFRSDDFASISKPAQFHGIALTRRNLAAAITVFALLAVAYIIVYASGGTSFAYVHVTYVPIIAASARFGAPGGLVSGILAGVLMGPLMPLNVETMQWQGQANWLIRAGFFTAIGGLAGLVFSTQARHLVLIKQSVLNNPLTGLPNRTRCLQILDQMLGRRTSNEPIVFLSLAIGRFEDISSAFGHDPSDIIQKQAAERISRLLPPQTALYQMTSGVFGLILTTSPDRAAVIATELIGVLDEPFIVEHIPIWTGGHGGIAANDPQIKGSMDLIRASFSALRLAEGDDQQLAIYDCRRDRAHRAAFSLLPDIQRAIRTQLDNKDTGGEVALHYQPKIRLATGECTGAEALIRWRHPERGMIPPDEFIPMIEQTVMIAPLTQLVLTLAFEQASKWQSESIDLVVAVNVSVRNLEDESFCEMVADLLRRHGVNPSQIELEVMESGLMSSPTTVTANLARLRALGLSIALDDFGTGRSSLSYLKDLPADTLKFDRSFIQRLAKDRKNRAIVGSTIGLAHDLGFQVVAEGVEDATIADLLTRLSCDQAQGYFISRPLDADGFVDWIRSRQHRPA